MFVVTAGGIHLRLGRMHLSVETVIGTLVILNLIGLTIAAYVILRRK